MDKVAEIRRIVEQSKDTADPITHSTTTLEGVVVHHAKMMNTVALNVAKTLLAEIDRLKGELQQAQEDWQDERNKLVETSEKLQSAQQDKQKIIEWVKSIATCCMSWDSSDEFGDSVITEAKELLKEIGVTE